MSVGELEDRIRRRIEREPELVISPAYFLALRDRFPKISRVDIRPLRGFADNEMTRYRYEAILHVGPGTGSLLDAEFHDWAERKWSLDDIRSMLRQHPNECIGVKRIRNARIEKDLAAIAALRDADAALTAGELRRGFDQYAAEGIHPRRFWTCKRKDWGSLFLSVGRLAGLTEVMMRFFIPNELPHGAAEPVIGWPERILPSSRASPMHLDNANFAAS